MQRERCLTLHDFATRTPDEIVEFLSDTMRLQAIVEGTPTPKLSRKERADARLLARMMKRFAQALDGALKDER